MKLHFLKISTLIIITIFFASCKKQTQQDVPSYIKIDKANLITQGNQGTAYNNITDIWVYDGNNLIGAFELPLRCPILKEGKTNFNFYAGIKMNGTSSTRVPYPFFKVNSQEVNLYRDSVVNISNLDFIYDDLTEFAWVESFETPNLSFENTSYGNVNIKRFEFPELNNLIEGEINNYAAGAEISLDSLIIDWKSAEEFDLPTNGKECFVELSYKCNNTFMVGLVCNGPGLLETSHNVVVINPTENWNRIYINLTPTLSSYNSYSKFRLLISATKKESNETAKIYFDNIKLLHFPK